MNGTLLAPRPYNKHDQLLQDFVKEQELKNLESLQHTFFHHSGKSSSQIDYILSTEIDVLSNLEISGKDAENTSSHVKVSALLLDQISEGTVKTKINSARLIKKLKWEKADRKTYVQTLESELVKYKHTDTKSTEQRLTDLTTVIHTATDSAVPSAVIKLKGPKRKASPRVRKQLKYVNKNINVG